MAFLALVFTALALAPYDAHLFLLPNKIGGDSGGVLRVRLPGQCRDAELDRCTGLVYLTVEELEPHSAVK